MKKTIHPAAGALAMLCIATFWLATAASELFASEATIRWVKTTIPWGFLLLIPALMATGASGWALAHGRHGGLIGAKIVRMRVIAANGILLLVPAAFFLAHKAQIGAFDSAFYGVQALELIAGAVNLVLMGLNMRDGRRMAGHFHRNRP